MGKHEDGWKQYAKVRSALENNLMDFFLNTLIIMRSGSINRTFDLTEELM